MPDINLDAHGDGIRMTWPRAAILAIALLVAGGTWARVELRMSELTRGQEQARSDMRELTRKVEELNRTVMLRDLPPVQIDSRGRILQ